MKYMGSKARLSKDIAPIIQKQIDENGAEIYIEPFVGGANMMEHIKCKKRIGNDINDYLIAMWNELQKGYTPPNEITKDSYIDVKYHKELFPKHLVAIIGFCASYNAKWFGGYAGTVKTKVGTIRNYYDESVRNILKQVPKIKDVEFVCGEYTQFSNIENAVIYCDPPYQNTTDYNVTNGFNHDDFWEWVRQMSVKNIVLVSEYNAPQDFECIFEKQLTTTLDKNSRKKDTEKLFIFKK